MKKYFMILICAPMLLCAENSIQEEFNLLVADYQKKNWKGVIDHSKVAIKETTSSPFLSDIYFLTAVAFFNQRDYEMSNSYLTTFLEKYSTPKYFEDAVLFKFQIAEHFEKGAKKHMMGLEALPQWLPAYDDAYALYDEVIATLPRHEVAAKAMFNKAGMLQKEEKFNEAIDLYQKLIARFPKHPLAPEGYFEIAKTYLEESENFYASPDFLELAKVNLKKFKRDFPGDPKVEKASMMLIDMEDHYAKDLWTTAAYFEKKKKIGSAVLYYEEITNRYPESSYATNALNKLSVLKVRAK